MIYQWINLQWLYITMYTLYARCVRLWCDAMWWDAMELNAHRQHISNNACTYIKSLTSHHHLSLSHSVGRLVGRCVCRRLTHFHCIHKRIAQDTQATYKGAQLTNATILNHTHFKFRFGSFFPFVERFIAKYDGTIYRKHQLFSSKRTTSIWLNCVFFSLGLSFPLFFSLSLIFQHLSCSIIIKLLNINFLFIEFLIFFSPNFLFFHFVFISISFNEVNSYIIQLNSNL